MSTSTQNPQLQPPAPSPTNASVQPGAPDFIETPDVPSTPSLDHEPLPVWLYLVCGAALFLAGSSFTGFDVFGLYDAGPGAPIVATTDNTGPIKPPDPMEMGKQVYQGNCANCHQASGEGQPGSYPPMVGSEWVLGNPTTLEALLLHGLQGSLTVKGGSYGTQQMPGWATALSDEKIADVMTYIRASWGNTGAPVTVADVTAARAKFASHADAYTEPELEKIAPGSK